MKQSNYFQKKKVLIFDLDHTIISCDSLKYFLLKWFSKKPKIFFMNLLYLIFVYVLYNIRLVNREKLKEIFLIVAFKGSSKKEILKFSESFARLLISKYLRVKTKKILNKKNCIKILVSASPNFYVKIIGKILKFDQVYSTKIDLNKKIGKIIGKNCYGTQKLLIIKKLKHNTKYLYFFTDSKSDVPLLNYCKKTFVIPKTISDKFFLRKYKKLNW